MNGEVDVPSIVEEVKGLLCQDLQVGLCVGWTDIKMTSQIDSHLSACLACALCSMTCSFAIQHAGNMELEMNSCRLFPTSGWPGNTKSMQIWPNGKDSSLAQLCALTCRF